MGRVTENLSYRVKNTFISFEDETHQIRGRAPSEISETGAACEAVRSGPAASHSKAAVAAAFYMPDTPSPFLHPASRHGGGSLPPLGLAATGPLGFAGDMALPPAFGEGQDSFGMGLGPPFDGQDLGGFYDLPAMMYDPSSGMIHGWCMPMEGGGSGTAPAAGGEGEVSQSHPDLSLDLLEGMGAPGAGMSADMERPGPAKGTWCTDSGMLLDGQGCPLKEGFAEGQWNTDAGIPMDGQGGLMMDGSLGLDGEHADWGPESLQAIEQGCGPMGDMLDGQGWNSDGGLPMDGQGSILDNNGMPLDGHQDWGAEAGLSMEGCSMGDGRTDGQGWSDGSLAMDQGRPMNEQITDGSGWGADSEQGRGPEGEQGRTLSWRAKGARGGRRQQQQASQQQCGSLAESPHSASGGEVPPSGGNDVGNGSAGTDVAPSGGVTTVMLRNIPNKYTRQMLVNQLSQEFRGRFDFVYLPIDFKNRCNVGYGFINFRTVDACLEFVDMFNGVDVRKCLPGLNSRKIAEVTPARVQGLEENVRRLRNGPVMNELVHHSDWMPLLLDDSGEEMAFPPPDQPCPPVKPRRRAGRSEEHGGSASGGPRNW